MGAGTGPAGPAAAGPMFTRSLRHDDITLVEDSEHRLHQFGKFTTNA